jgi:hypothetical protein
MHTTLALTNPDMSIRDGEWTPPSTCELAPSQILRDLTVCGISQISTAFQVVDSLPLEESNLTAPLQEFSGSLGETIKIHSLRHSGFNSSIISHT